MRQSGASGDSGAIISQRFEAEHPHRRGGRVAAGDDQARQLDAIEHIAQQMSHRRGRRATALLPDIFSAQATVGEVVDEGGLAWILATRPTVSWLMPALAA